MKRIIISLALLGYFHASANAQIDIIKADESGLVVEFTAGSIKVVPMVKGDRTFHQISVEGCINTFDCGKPSLPQYSIIAAIPSNSEASIVQIELLEREYIPATPVPGPAPDEMDSGLVIDNAVYQAPAAYPARAVGLNRSGWARNNKTVTVTFFPVIYEPDQARVVFNRKIRAVIAYKPAANYAPGLWPAESCVDKVLYRTLINSEQAEKWRSRTSAKAGPISCDTLPYKMFIRSEGIYKVGYSDLTAAGINASLVDPRSLKVVYHGREIPVYFQGQADGIFDQDDYFEFYGQAIKGDSTYYHQFSNTNVYYLSLTGSPGARMIEEDGTPSLPGIDPAGQMPETIHWEKDSLFYRLDSWNSNQLDRWFWKRLDYPEYTVINLDIPSPVSGPGDSATISGSLHGITLDEHHIQLLLNDHLIADLTWSDQTERTFIAKFPAAVIKNGLNGLTIKHAGTLSTRNKVLINWFEINYRRGFSVPAGELVISTDASPKDSLAQFTLTDLPSYIEDVYKLGVSRITGSAISLGANGLGYDLSFQDRVFGGEEYYIVQKDNKKSLSPGDIVLNRPSNLRDPTFNGTKYVIIASDLLEESAQKMTQARRPEYPDAKYVLTSDIYDEFSQGIPSDQAIRDYLIFAFQSWAVQPEYVLILGDGSYDPRNVIGNSKPDMVPVHLTRTDWYGGVADDDYYARVNGDDYLPDISVGRLPVNTNQEFDVWDDKRRLYEQRLFLDRWHKEILLVAGWPLNSEDNFYNPSDKLASAISPVFDISKVYHGSAYQNKEDLINRLNQGVAVAVFFGHGGAQLWSHGSFFWYYDVPRLNNWGRWPLIGSFTCSSGAFESPTYTSLSESFIFNLGGGIGVYSSSGASYGDSINGCAFEKTFLDAFDKKGLRNFGDIALSSKYSLAGGMPVSGQTLDMLVSYNLLSDPAIRLALPDTGLAVEISSTSITPGDSTLVKITGPFGAGMATISLYDATQTIVLQSVFSCQPGQALTYITVPDSVLPGQASMKVYLKDDNADWVAVEYLGIDRPAVSGIKTVPSNPTDIDSIQITGIIQSLAGIDSVWCHWNWGGYSDTAGSMNHAIMTATTDTYSLSGKIYLDGLAGNYHPGDDNYLLFKIYIQDTLDNVTSSRWQIVKIPMRPDLVPASSSQEAVILGGKRTMSIKTAIANQGDMDAYSVPVCFYRSQDDSLLGTCTIDTILAGKEATAAMPWSIEGEFTQIYYRIDPAHSLVAPYPQEDTINDRSVVYWVPAQDYYYYQLDHKGFHPDTLNYYDHIKSVFADSCLHDSAVSIVGRKVIDITGITQGGLIPYDSLGQAYFVGLTDSSRDFDNHKYLWIALKLENYDSTAGIENLKLFRLDDLSGMWQLIPSQVQGGYIQGYSPKTGTFAAMYAGDTTGPYITAKVDRQALGWGQVISIPAPQFSILIEDQDGVNIDSIWVKLDDLMVNRSNYSLALNPNNSFSVPMIYSPTLTNGKHHLEFGATDNLGNKSSIRISSEVNVSFALKEIANYPNPVNGDITTFYIYVGDIADSYELKVYTVAGRLIKTFTGGRTSGVRTFEWDLSDDNGSNIANGVYFYTVKVYHDGEMQGKTGKMAVLR